MNREIKFRAWCPELNSFWGIGEIDGISSCYHFFDQNGLLTVNVSVENENDFFNSKAHPCIIMQYTGLKDKNGTEIYEGDILIHPDDYGDVMLICWNDKEAKFEAHRHGIGISTGEDYQDIIDEWKGYKAVMEDFTDIVIYEIIGNKHQNPKLL